MTYVFERYYFWAEPETGYMEADPEGQWVKAEDAINREAVNADRIRVLELQLKEAKSARGIG